MRGFLARQGASCKCGHDPDHHRDEVGSCTAPDTRPMIGSPIRDKPCPCRRYRPSLLLLLIEGF